MPRRVTSRFVPLRLERLEDRVNPGAFQVNDAANDPDDDLTDGKPETASGKITLRAVFDHMNKVGGSHTVTFSGPMSISSTGLSYTKGAVTFTGISGGEEGPKVKITGGLNLGNGNKLTDLHFTNNTVLVGSGNTITKCVFSNISGTGLWLNLGGNKVKGCYIGTTPDGKGAQANTGDGILLRGPGNTIGGTSAADRNVISANLGNGIRAESFSGPQAVSGTFIVNNYIGVSVDGSKNLINRQWGIRMEGTNNRIGGMTAAEANVIVAVQPGGGGGSGGVEIRSGFSGASGNKIQGNLFNTKLDGNTLWSPEAQNPTGIGVLINAITGSVTNTTVQNNVIADFASGVRVAQGIGKATGTQLLGNKIGVGKDGSTPLRNLDGIEIGGADQVTIGGTTESSKNIISGNKRNGVFLHGSADENRFNGNYIGTNASGDEIGNGVRGIYIQSGSKNKIGGISTGKTPVNVIAFNGDKADTGKGERGHGVQIDDGKGNVIRLNSIYDNKALGIYLRDAKHPNELPQNDVGRYDPAAGKLVENPDADEGPNGLLNHPVVKSIAGSKITWQFNAKANTTYTLDFYGDEKVYDLGYGQGKSPFTTLSVTTDIAGHWEGPVSFGSSQKVAATATHADEGTSTFSIVDTDADGLADGWEQKGGIDLDIDETVDANTLGGANANQKDIFLEVDTVGGVPGGIEAAMQAAFLAAPASIGPIHLHFRWGGLGAPGVMQNLAADTQGVRAANFGDGLSAVGKRAHAMGYRYAAVVNERGFVAPGQKKPGESGFSESGTLRYNNKLVRFGGDTMVLGVTSADARDFEGTLMHELGHTLGLLHGGNDEVNYKPNNYTVMNYLWQIPNGLQQEGKTVTGTYDAGWKLDYSRVTSANINEIAGKTAITIATPAGQKIPVSNAYEFNLLGVVGIHAPLGGKAWRLVDGGVAFTPLPPGQFGATGRVDLNGDGAVGTLTGSIDEWAVLQLNHRESSTYLNTFGAVDAGLIRAPAGGGPIGVSAVEDFVVGADAGSPPRVQVFAPDGTIRHDFLAFDVGFVGGVRVARGDVNGDGVADIFAAQGNGGGEVRVFDGKDASPLFTRKPLGDNFVAGVYVAAGDVNGDGKADLIAAPGGGTGSTVKVVDLANDLELYSILAYTATTKTGVTTAAGDVNGDGRADIIVAPGSGASPLVKIFSGATGKLLSSFSEPSAAFNGVNLASADVNGDGKWDVITATAGGTSKSGPVVRIHSGKSLPTILGAFLADDPTFLGGVRVGTVKLSNGGFDVVTATGPGKSAFVRRVSARTFQESWRVSPLDPTFNGAFVG